MTSANLEGIIEKYELYAKERVSMPREVVIDKMRDDIQLEMVSADVVDPRSGQAKQATIAFTLSYENQSPDLAQKVANEIVSLYLSENLKARTESATETSTFLRVEANKLSEKVSSLESELAAFKERNMGKLPELTQLNIELMGRAELEMDETQRQIRTLEERKIYLQSELAQLSPHEAIFTETGERILGASDRLKVLQTEFVGLSSKYGSGHPDVIRMRKEIEALEQGDDSTGLRGEMEVELKGLRTEKYSENHPDVKRLNRMIANLEKETERLDSSRQKVVAKSSQEPTNPAYIQLQAQLEAANVEIVSLKTKQQELKGKVASYENRLVETPAVEREYRQLMREYENALAKHREVTAKEMEAQVAQSLETERKGEKLTLIEPPQLPGKPAKPNRTAIMFLGVVFSFAGGIGTAAISESMDNAVYGRGGVVSLLGVPPLAVIPVIETDTDRRRRRVRRCLIAAFLILGLFVAAFLVHVYVKPLDVLWFMVLRQLGV